MSPKHSTYNCLIIEDDSCFTRAILEACARKGIHAIVSNSSRAIREIENNKYDMVFLSRDISGTIGSQQAWSKLASISKNRFIDRPVVITGSDNTAKAGIEVIRSGCEDYITNPISQDQLSRILEVYLPDRNLTNYENISHRNGEYKLIGNSVKIREALAIAKKVASSSAPVIITGPSGTGKELIAQLIHNESKRSKMPYVRVNCAAMSDSLLQSELFGHEKGAFTNAFTKKLGRFERANNGTLLLDEITETSLEFQAQLLRVLESQTIERVGGEEEIDINVRIISTTNKDILKEVREGNFRKDLYYRLSAIRIKNPALSERRDDIEQLIWHFVSEFSAESMRNIKDLCPEMLEIFRTYSWPGNIRQLRNVVRSCMIMGSGPTLSIDEVSWLEDELKMTGNAKSDINFNMSGIPLEIIEKEAILATLRQEEGNQTKAAKLLGITSRTLREKIKRYREDSAQTEQNQEELTLEFSGA